MKPEDAVTVYRKPSSTPSGFFGSGPENIIELENFMTQEEVSFLDNAARSIKIWDVTESHKNENGTVIYDADYWKDRVASAPSLNQNNPNIVPVIVGLFNKLQPIIEDFFKVKVRPTGQTIVKWPPGYYQLPHADKELHSGPDAGTPNDFPNYDIASLFYINDDYEGGELYFPQHDNFTLKPKAGSMLIFSGTIDNMHGINEVTNGTRYTHVTFWSNSISKSSKIAFDKKINRLKVYENNIPFPEA